jgi:hypothetical protein
MKLATIALASVLALSSTFALAYTSHHRTYHHGYHGYRGTVGMSSARPYRGSTNYGNPNNRGGLVGGADSGTYRP